MTRKILKTPIELANIIESNVVPNLSNVKFDYVPVSLDNFCIGQIDTKGKRLRLCIIDADTRYDSKTKKHVPIPLWIKRRETLDRMMEAFETPEDHRADVLILFDGIQEYNGHTKGSASEKTVANIF